MLWSEFKELVRVHLHAYNRTHGVQTLIEALIRAGAEDLQSSVPALRTRTEAIPVASVTTQGLAGRVEVPVGSFLDSVFARDTSDPSEIRKYTRVSYSKLEDMKLGNLRDGDRAFIFEPSMGYVWVFPVPSNEQAEVCLRYSTISADFSDTTEVVFGSGEAEAVADSILAKLALKIDHDVGASQLHQENYRNRKRQVMSDRNEAHISLPL